MGSPPAADFKTVFCGHFRVHIHKYFFSDGLPWMSGSQVSSLQAFVEAISRMPLCGIAFDVVETFLQRPASSTQFSIQQGNFLHHPIVLSYERQVGFAPAKVGWLCLLGQMLICSFLEPSLASSIFYSASGFLLIVCTPR